MPKDYGCEIFISYAREDLERARVLVRALKCLGWSVFWDRTIPAGSTWREYIGQRLDTARCVVVAWSAASVCSRFVIEEAEDGDRRGVLAPVLFDDVLPPLGLRSVQAADLSKWSGQVGDTAFGQFVTDLKRLLGSPPNKKHVAEREIEEEDARLEAEAQEGLDDPSPSLLPHLLVKGLFGLFIGALLGASFGYLSGLGVAIGLSAGLLTGACAGLAIGYRR